MGLEKKEKKELEERKKDERGRRSWRRGRRSWKRLNFWTKLLHSLR